MNDDRPDRPEPDGATSGHQPVFLIPRAVTALIGTMWAVHVASFYGLDLTGLGNLRLWLGYVPMRLVSPEQFGGGMLPMLWTPLTHAFLHADWMHLTINTAWLAVFGTPVARRYGGQGALLVFTAGAVAGALVMTLSMASDLDRFAVLIGASGGVSALTGAAMRFVFEPVVLARDPETGAPRVLGRRTASIKAVFTRSRARAFVIIWLGLNLAIPLMPLITGGAELPIAWEAHIGGFLAGLLLPSWFDRRALENEADRAAQD